jgi:hypothetical protein
MDDGKKHLYVKFKIDNKLKIMDQMIIYESRSTVDEWKASEVEQAKPKVSKEQSKLDLFQKNWERF